MKLDVRKITEADIEGFRLALISVINERQYLLTLDEPVAEDVSRFVRANIKNNVAEVVALVDDEVVGWADILPHKKEALSHSGLLGIGVVSAHRGKGIGTELLKQVIERAWETGLKRIELEVFASNKSAISLYEKFGFKHEGKKLNGRLVDGEYRDVCLMAQCRL